MPQTTSPETSSTSEDQVGAATEIIDVSVDDSWTIREEASDVCDDFTGPSGSVYSTQDDIFTCGPIAIRTLACAYEGDGETVCMTDVQNRTAMRFSWPTVASEDVGPREIASMPLYVELDGGATCSAIERDHDRHWCGLYSWYRCSDGSELLTDQTFADTFDSSTDTWTAQRSTNMGAPVETSVKTVAYAGK